MEKIYFISDAHLGAGGNEEEKKKEEKLLSFLKHIQTNNSRLFILGDFFDVWFEYKHAIPNKNFRILKALADLTEQGINIDFLIGNHDCWINSFFSRQLGIKTHTKPLDITLQGKRLFLAHGHGLINQKPGDIILKKIIENPINIYLYRLVSPDVGIPVARGISRLSRFFGNKKMNPEDVKGYYIEFAKNRLDDGFDAVIMGHTHTGRVINFDEKVYMNLGDWITLFSYGLLEDGQLSLNFW